MGSCALITVLPSPDWSAVTLDIDFMKQDVPLLMYYFFFPLFTLFSSSQATFSQSLPVQLLPSGLIQSEALITKKRNSLATNCLLQSCIPVIPCLGPLDGVLSRFFKLVQLFPTYHTDFVIKKNVLYLRLKCNWIWQIFFIQFLVILLSIWWVVTIPCFSLYFCFFLFIWLVQKGIGGERAHIHCLPWMHS